MSITLILAGVALVVLVSTMVWRNRSDRADRNGPKRPMVWDDVQAGPPTSNTTLGEAAESNPPSNDAKGPG
jgi:hypothetical protein